MLAMNSLFASLTSMVELLAVLFLFDDVNLPAPIVALRKILSEMTAAALFAPQRRPRRSWHRKAGPRAEDQPLDQRVSRRPVGAVDAGAGHLPRRKESRQRCTPPLVGFDAAHDVVGRGTDGNRIAREIQADAGAH